VYDNVYFWSCKITLKKTHEHLGCDTSGPSAHPRDMRNVPYLMFNTFHANETCY